MIVGLVGSIGNGKGTVADILVNKHGFIKESFANSVKDAVSVIFGWDRKLLEGDTSESREWREQPDVWWSEKLGREMSPRYALQLMGTEAGRDVFHSDLWILALHKRTMGSIKNFVIADVRFPNEIKSIRENGGKVFRVKRGNDPIWYETALMENTIDAGGHQILNTHGHLMSQKYPEIHFSEWAWVGEHIDGTIENNGTLENLEDTINKTLNFS
jgi:hypothetical protein